MYAQADGVDTAGEALCGGSYGVYGGDTADDAGEASFAGSAIDDGGDRLQMLRNG